MTEPTNPRPEIDLTRLSGRNRSRSKNPAASAKILATGLSATAMLGMSAGYAVAARESNPTIPPAAALTQGTQATAPGAAPTNGNATALAPLAPLVPGTAVVANPQVPQSTAVTQAQAPQAPVATQPQIVEIPVETIAPAAPGNGGGGWNNQPSSGSN